MVSVELTANDLLLINNALNEVCNGIHLDDHEFATRLGASRDETMALLHRISKLLTPDTT